MKILALAFSTALALAIPAGVTAAPRDDAVLAAADAYRARDSVRLARAAQAARGHVLEPYVDYWALLLRLDEVNPESIREFMARYRATYVADRLRAEWIRQLGRRADWSRIAQEAQPGDADDADVACWVMQARWRLGDVQQRVRARVHWDQPRTIPDGCVPLVESLAAEGQITHRQVWDRIRMLLDAGQLTATARTVDLLPPPEQLDRKTLDQISANPGRWLERTRHDFARRAHRELIAFAIARMARTDVLEAAERFERSFAARLPPDERAFVYAQLALTASRRHMPEAVVWFAQADAVPLSDEQLAWRVRAALREAKWNEVTAAIAKMPTTQRSDPTWIYWLGRAHRELGRPDEANDLFGRIAHQPNFYGKLAAEELGQVVRVPGVGHIPTADELAAAGNDGGLQRALALYRLNLRMEAVREWNFSIRGWDDKRLLAAAEIARRNEVWDRAINTADRTAALHDYNLRFLAPYRPLFAEFAKQQGLEESWVLGLVRQESRFIPGVKSSAGAMGLMQLMPATATMVARKAGMKDFSLSGVTDPRVNIQLGTSYMREVLDSLDNHPLLASAAYNAGPGRAQRWRSQRPIEGAIYAETIPFNETRDYVKKVLSNTMYYAALAGETEQRTLKARLGVIAPRGSAPGGPVPVAGTPAPAAPAAVAPEAGPAAAPSEATRAVTTVR